MISFSSGTRSTMSSAVRAQRLAQGVAPAGQLGLALAEKGADQALKRLRQRRIGDVALVLVELAGREEPARRHQRLVQLVDDGGLADAGIAGDQHQLRRAARRRRDRRRRARSRPRALSRTASRGSAAGPACRVRPAGSHRCGPGLPSRPGSAADRAPGRPRSGSAPRRSWRAAS